MPRSHSRRFKSEFWGWSQSVTSFENSPDVSYVQPELGATRPEAVSGCQSQAGGGKGNGRWPTFQSTLCWNEDQVSMWIDEDSRQKGLVRNQVHLLHQHTGSPAGLCAGFCGTVPVSAQSCAWVHVSSARAGLVRVGLR